MQLDVLATRNSGAAENMATDFLLLQRYEKPDHVRFRHYGWHRPAVTFGYSQKIAFVREQFPGAHLMELCRRPTGGGLVDHRDDWTYALVIPRKHAAYDDRAIESYRVVHTCIMGALRALGQNATLKNFENQTGSPPSSSGICFKHAELLDVIHAESGLKIAGAAQKRNKHGLLFQGSLSRAALPNILEWDRFQHDLCHRLASALNVVAQDAPWPDWEDGELSQLVDHYSTPEWNEFR